MVVPTRSRIPSILGMMLLASCNPLSRSTPETLETIAQGDEEDLRERLRPIRGTTRVLIIAFDGVGHHILDERLRGGHMPRLSAVLGAPVGDADQGLFEHAWSVPNAMTILPSTTFAAWVSIFTGEPPARTGVPGNEWLAREELRYYAPAPVSVTGHADTWDTVNDGLVGRVTRVPTLFERANVRSHVSLAALHRGADVFTMPGPTSYVSVLDDFLEGVATIDNPSTDAYADLDEESVDTALDLIEEEGLPDLQVLYFPGIDMVTHVIEDPLDSQREYLSEVIDPALGEAFDAWREKRALDRTFVIIVADHGHTPVLDDDAHSLSTGGDDEPTAVLEEIGFRLRDDEVGEVDPNAQAAVAYQGAIAYVYLADRSTCPGEDDDCDWRAPPRFEEDVLAVARAFHEASTEGRHVPELRGSLDVILAREPVSVDRSARAFQVFDGERLVPVDRWVRENRRDDLIDLDRRLRDLAEGPLGHRAGDVLLITKSGVERPIEERYYFSDPYRSWHGSPTRQDSHIPLVIARPSMSGAQIRRLARRSLPARPTQLDVTPLVLHLLATE